MTGRRFKETGREMRKEQECENTATGEIRKERGEKGLGIGEQSLENDVSVRSTEFCQSPDGHLVVQALFRECREA